MKKKFALLTIIVVLCITFSFIFAGCNGNLGEKVGEVTISIECKTILNNMDKVDKGILDNNLIPKDGIILGETKVTAYSKDNVYTLLQRVCREKKIHLDCALEPVFKTYYIKGINYIYEMSVGESSGWMYFVDGVQPDQGISLYKLKGGEKIKVAYTCVMGDLK